MALMIHLPSSTSTQPPHNLQHHVIDRSLIPSEGRFAGIQASLVQMDAQKLWYLEDQHEPEKSRSPVLVRRWLSCVHVVVVVVVVVVDIEVVVHRPWRSSFPIVPTFWPTLASR